MKKIIGYTDQITECECCGKTDLKGTYCIYIDGAELYYGSTCAFKSHGISQDDQKIELSKFKSIRKIKEKLKAMEQDHDNAPSFGKLFNMVKFAISNQNYIEAKVFFEKYGNKSNDISNDKEEHFYIPQTSQQTWIIN